MDLLNIVYCVVNISGLIALSYLAYRMTTKRLEKRKKARLVY
jgi:uncharacterized membrane protein YuzA (DUF378 family)